MSIRQYAKSELAGINHDESGLQSMIDECVLELVDVFSKQGHSNHSAHYVISVLERVLNFLPITPLTGEDDEWEKENDGIYRNKRCMRVIRENGIAYDTMGKVFSDDGGKTWWSNINSLTPVEFPYFPPTEPEKVMLSGEDE